ncbi:hypothetical protein [Acidipropionibacterium timonense]|uniref:hypothetical protein n=1 Tax=Acidipropionibacterium timonense TaxID=2161818 RepID=UPI0014368172|nr:hypothetical protein [Acidipropionibacterium timonense]
MVPVPTPSCPEPLEARGITWQIIADIASRSGVAKDTVITVLMAMAAISDGAEDDR